MNRLMNFSWTTHFFVVFLCCESQIVFSFGLCLLGGRFYLFCIQIYFPSRSNFKFHTKKKRELFRYWVVNKVLNSVKCALYTKKSYVRPKVADWKGTKCVSNNNSWSNYFGLIQFCVWFCIRNLPENCTVQMTFCPKVLKRII